MAEAKKITKVDIELEKDSKVNERYTIQYRLGKGGFGKVYLATRIDTGKSYALKVLSNTVPFKLFKRECDILLKLGNIDKDKEESYSSPYVLKIHEAGRFKASDNIKRFYLVVDYCEKGDLYNYIKLSQGLDEIYAKILFKRILEGIKHCHNKNICHLDIKVANILLDDKFNPIINDFGLSREISTDDVINPLKGKKGTDYMMCPQMFEKDVTYNGIDADIFALGVLLLEIVTSKRAFEKSTDDIYTDIKDKNYDLFWKKVSVNLIINLTLSQEFKDLYVKMIAYNPEERPKIEDIFNDPWLYEINNKSDLEYSKLENDYIKMMTEVEEKIKQKTEITVPIPPKIENNEESKVKSISSDVEVKYFNENLKPKKLTKINNYKYFIKMKGYINSVQFMNSLANKIIKKYKDDCTIEASKKKLKFQIFFEKEEEEEEEKEETEEEEYKRSRDCIIEIKLFENEKDEYLLCFDKRQGALEEFYENFMIIKGIAEEILK